MLNIPKATSDYQATMKSPQVPSTIATMERLWSDFRTPATIATIATMILKSSHGLATIKYIFIIAYQNIIKSNHVNNNTIRKQYTI